MSLRLSGEPTNARRMTARGVAMDGEEAEGADLERLCQGIMGEQRWIFSTPISFRNHSVTIQDRERAAGPWCITKKLDTKRLNISGRWK